MSKGEETKNRILFVARDLFYEYGFHKTTARMISEKANTNLGLLNYYFKNKNEMGLIIYSSIRDRFDELIAEYFPDMDELMLFLFSSTLELYLCITNEKYGNFFHEFIGGEPKNRRFIQEHISDVFCRYSSEYAAYNTFLKFRMWFKVGLNQRSPAEGKGKAQKLLAQG